MVQSLAGVQARKADFAQMSLADQLQLVASDTDILVGGYSAYSSLQQNCVVMPEWGSVGMLCGKTLLSTTAAAVIAITTRYGVL